jgi:hypothetical protein
MIYTVRYAHLKHIPHFPIETIIKPQDMIGIMGNTGKSTADHLHIDTIISSRVRPWRQLDMERRNLLPAPKQLNFFIDAALFNQPLVITSYYCDPIYMDRFGILHFGYDVRPKYFNSDTDYTIYWNRSFTGKVIAVGFDNGYGNYIHIEFER